MTRFLFAGRNTDGLNNATRVSAYGEPVVGGVGTGVYPVAAEGAYFRATNPTFGTGFVASVAAATGFLETQASIIVRNTSTVAGKDIYLDYIRVQIAAAPTGNTDWKAVIALDNFNRTGAGGVAATITNSNSGTPVNSIASVLVGAITAGAANASRKLIGGPIVLKQAVAPCLAVNDIFLFDFGRVDTKQPAPGTTAAWACGPVYLPTNADHSFLLSFFGTLQSAAPTIHLDMGWFER